MKLCTLLEDFHEFSLATPKDNREILEFYHEHQMQTKGLGIFYHRGEDFFKFLKVQGEENFVFLYRNEQNQVKGVATITTRKQIVNGVPCNVLYLGDLRAKANREVSKRWKLLYSKLMKHLNQIEEFKSTLNFTVIMYSNLKAINSLVKGQNEFEYIEISPFKMVNVFCKIPLYPTQSELFVQPIQDIDEVKEFINREGVKYQLGVNYEIFKNRFNVYSKLENKNVLKVCRGEEIIASGILWEPSEMKKIILKNLPWYLKLFNLILELITYAPTMDQELKILYLNDLIIKESEDKDLIIKAILDYLHENDFFKRYHSIAYASFDKAPIELKGYLKDKTPLLFYTVRAPGREDVLTFGDGMNFNLSWV